ncbi:MAG: membrane metalloprotease [Lutibacter sp.]|nr:membrane metalloprotease [Lutibacter sp.]
MFPKKNYFFSVVFLILTLTSCNKNDDFNGGSYSYKSKIGNSANDILSNAVFTDLYIEVMYVEGFSPSSEALKNLETFIKARTYKSLVIIESRLISIEKKDIYTIDDVRTIEDANRLLFTQNNQLVVSALFLNGKSSSDKDSMVILGTAHRNTSFVIFEESIKKSTNFFFERAELILETSVILHEFCHLLGLVNIGSPMISDHQDDENGYHCNNPKCLMYYQEESFYNRLNKYEIPKLDANCLADLRANGGK